MLHSATRLALGLWLFASGAVGWAQTEPLADSSAWEPLGGPLQIEGFDFSGDPQEPLVWADGLGLWAIQDVAGPWVEIDRLRPRNGSVYLYGPNPAIPDTIFAGSPLYRSTDGGQTFVRIETPNDLGGGSGIGSGNTGFERASPGTPHAYRVIAADHLGFLLSDDGGDTWVAADTTPPLIAFSIKALQSGRILAAGFYGAVRSDDGGITWHHIPALYDTDQVRFDVQRVAVLPGFVTGQSGDSEEGRIVLSGTQGGTGGGWYQWWSDNDGETWTRSIQPGGVQCGEGVDLLSLVSETGQPGDVVAVTCSGVVLLSNDGAESWVEIGRVPGVSPETDTSVETAALGSDGRIYVGTRKLGPTNAYSYRTKWRASDGFAVSASERPAANAPRLTASPNPARQLVTLELADSNRQPVEIVIVDTQGREVARNELAGGSSWRLDVSGWAPGAYLARIVGEQQLDAVAFTVIR